MYNCYQTTAKWQYASKPMCCGLKALSNHLMNVALISVR